MFEVVTFDSVDNYAERLKINVFSEICLETNQKKINYPVPTFKMKKHVKYS